MKFAVIGLGFGDEGKGMVTDYLCSKSYNPLVVRFSGGHQAGHTVVKENIRHVFSNFGSGTLSGAPTYWSSFCTVEPIGLINELNILLGKNIRPTLFIDKKCPMTTPYDVYYNQKIEKENNHGTCGVGFGATIRREELLYSLLIRDIQHESVTNIKVDLIKQFYDFPESIILKRFFECIEEMRNSPYIIFVDAYPYYYENIIYEGSQGLLLDKNMGFFPYVTRSNVGMKNIASMDDNIHVYLVTRAYQTRHGNGIMTNENIPHNILIDTNETNITNEYQGIFKRSLLDLDLLLYAIDKDDYIRNAVNKTLVITCLDHIENEYRFTLDGNIVYCDNESDFVSKISSILEIKDILLSKSPYSNRVKPY